MESILSNFFDRLKHARNLTSKTQQEFAQELGVGYRTYARYEAGQGYPDVESLQKIGTLSGIDMNWLIMGAKNEGTANIDLILQNSIENKIRKKIESQLNHFQHEIIFLHYALENTPAISFDELLNVLSTYKIMLIKSTLLHGITESDKKSAIQFLEDLEMAEKNYVLNNIHHFRRMIWENMDWFNKMFKKSPA
ncbi:helix-turn-helix domain protein [Sulfuricurvum kujiense DSM 16994]|uniref:Helix-turn-helix domain protein n=1 Tax=Sulfuricurvum kujiense (strain ATCC BAA-921 / DSM 16994 / JCM 11577 / YK-1) TaxID=709032 RepID=E4U0M8_SULKY|nr:helix-turn-helix transcriptional regulator [Sulfuricurvum kujiense]ADR34345.1 helix-turn-helix domain protein [Sulfuricurvum kujiense DSM 16994]